jgi:hypothetical protein
VPSIAGAPGTTATGTNPIPNNAEARPAPTPGQSGNVASGVDNTVTRNSQRPGCGSGTVGSSGGAIADTGTPRIMVDPALGNGRNVQTGGAGTISSTLPSSTRC